MEEIKYDISVYIYWAQTSVFAVEMQNKLNSIVALDVSFASILCECDTK